MLDKILLAVFMAFVINISGCGEDSSGGNSVEGSSTSNTIVKNITVHAERRFNQDFDLPIEIDWNRADRVIDFKHDAFYPDNVSGIYKNLTFSYMSEDGYLGNDKVSWKLYDKKNKSNYVILTYNITVIKAPLEGSRDYKISKFCNTINGKGVLSSGVDIVNDNLDLVEQVYDNNKTYTPFSIPKYSRIEVDYHGKEDLNSEIHHDTFKRNNSYNLRLTCNYAKGSTQLIYPLDAKEWYANRGTVKDNYHFSRNDLYFNISLLSDLYVKIYTKEYTHSGSRSDSHKAAKQFMQRTFPKSHFTAELARNYNTRPIDPITGASGGQMYQKFGEDNSSYIDILNNLAIEATDKNIFLVIDKISENYEMFYLNGQSCTTPAICASLFPEYTVSSTTNPQFENNLNGWTVDRVTSNHAVGNAQYLPVKKIASLELRATIPNNSGIEESYIEMKQTEIIDSDLDSYFIHFDLANVLGGAEGGSAFQMCISSGGIAGVYTLFRDAQGKQIGLIGWTDHCNKFDFAWGGVRNGVDSHSRFYNTRLRDVVRRINPTDQRFEFTASLGEMSRKYLPDLYSEKNQIYSIEFGVFAQERRNQSDGCYYCLSRIKAHEINLLKKK